MKKKMAALLLSATLCAGVFTGQCMAAGSQTKVVEVVRDSSSGSLNGEEIAVEIISANTDMESANEFQVVTVPDTQKPVINAVISMTREETSTYADVVAAAREIDQELTISVVYKIIKEENGEHTIVVTAEEGEQDYNLSQASALTAPFELYPESSEGELMDKLEDAVTTLKILELQALFENNSDNQELIDSIRIACWVTLDDGTMELQIIKPQSVDLETGNVEVAFGDFVPCTAQIIYYQDLAVLGE